MTIGIRTRVILGLAVVSLVWGSTWLAIKIGLRTVPPILSASLRFLIAAGLLGVLLYYRGTGIRKDPQFWRLAIFLSLLSFSIPFSLVYWGQNRIPSSLASILFAIFPFWVALFSYLRLPNEPMTLPKVFGIVCGFAGIVVIFSSELTLATSFAEWGMAAIVASAIMQAFALVILKKEGKGIDVVSLNFASMLISGCILFAFSMVAETFTHLEFGTDAILSLLYLATFGSVLTFVTYFWLVKHVEVVLLSLTAFVTPIIAVVLGTIVLNERLAPQVFAGSVLVLSGILLANAPDLLVVLKRGKALLWEEERS